MKKLIPQSSHIKYYWYAWLGIIAIAILLRFTVFLSVSQGSRFVIGLVYMISTWISIGILNLFEGERLRSYLKSHHNQKWIELTSVFGFVTGRFNSLSTLPWLYSTDDLGDPVLATLKEDHRQFIRLMLTIFFTYGVIVPILSA